MRKRKPGRPALAAPALTQKQVIDAALETFLQRKAFSMRGIARTLRVDPMALYHYYANKDELLAAVAAVLIDTIYRPSAPGNWRREVRALAISYLETMLKYPGLLETVVGLGAQAKGPAEVFRSRFAAATTGLDLSASQQENAISAIVDYVHGFSLAERGAKAGTLRASHSEPPLEVILDGIEHMARKYRR